MPLLKNIISYSFNLNPCTTIYWQRTYVIFDTHDKRSEPSLTHFLHLEITCKFLSPLAASYGQYPSRRASDFAAIYLYDESNLNSRTFQFLCRINRMNFPDIGDSTFLSIINFFECERGSITPKNAYTRWPCIFDSFLRLYNDWKHFLQIIYEVADPSSMISMSLPPPSKQFIWYFLETLCVHQSFRPASGVFPFIWVGGWEWNYGIFLWLSEIS